VWIERDGQFVAGDGGLKLLLGILEHGSLLGAARQIRWSYRRAWEYLRRADAALGMPLTERRPGKGAARGTVLTEAGRLVIERLAEIRNRIDDAVGRSGRRRPTSRPGQAPGPRDAQDAQQARATADVAIALVLASPVPLSRRRLAPDSLTSNAPARPSRSGRSAV